MLPSEVRVSFYARLLERPRKRSLSIRDTRNKIMRRGLNISEGSHDRSNIFEESHDRPNMPEESHDRPNISEESHDRPNVPEESHDRPNVPEESHDRPNMPEESHYKSDHGTIDKFPKIAFGSSVGLILPRELKDTLLAHLAKLGSLKHYTGKMRLLDIFTEEFLAAARSGRLYMRGSPCMSSTHGLKDIPGVQKDIVDIQKLDIQKLDIQKDLLRDRMDVNLCITPSEGLVLDVCEELYYELGLEGRKVHKRRHSSRRVVIIDIKRFVQGSKFCKRVKERIKEVLDIEIFVHAFCKLNLPQLKIASALEEELVLSRDTLAFSSEFIAQIRENLNVKNLARDFHEWIGMCMYGCDIRRDMFSFSDTSSESYLKSESFPENESFVKNGSLAKNGSFVNSNASKSKRGVISSLCSLSIINIRGCLSEEYICSVYACLWRTIQAHRADIRTPWGVIVAKSVKVPALLALNSSKQRDTLLSAARLLSLDISATFLRNKIPEI